MEVRNRRELSWEQAPLVTRHIERISVLLIQKNHEVGCGGSNKLLIKMSKISQ